MWEDYETNPEDYEDMIPPFLVVFKTTKYKKIILEANGQKLETKTNKKGQAILDLANLKNGYKDLSIIKITIK